MKTRHILFFFLLLSACRSEGEFGIPPNETFLKLYGGNGTQEGYDLLRMSDGGFLMIGCTTSIGAGGEDVYLVRTDEFGNEIWNRTFGDIGNDVGKGLLPTGETTLVLSEQTNQEGFKDIVVFSIDPNNSGNPTGQFDTGTSLGWGNTDETAAQIISTGDGFIIVGSTTNSDLNKTPSADTDPQDIYLAKVDNAGNLLWQKVYGNLGLDNGAAIIPWNDGYLILGDTDFSEQNGQSGRNYRLIYVSRSGRLLDARTFGEGGIQIAHDIIATQDGSIYLLGASGENSNYVKLDSDLSLVDDRPFSGQGGYAMVESLSGNLLITGKGGPIFITSINNDGFEQEGWPKSFGYQGQSIGRSILQSEDGSLAVCGTISFGSNRMMCLIKTDGGGNLTQ